VLNVLKKPTWALAVLHNRYGIAPLFAVSHPASGWSAVVSTMNVQAGLNKVLNRAQVKIFQEIFPPRLTKAFSAFTLVIDPLDSPL